VPGSGSHLRSQLFQRQYSISLFEALTSLIGRKPQEKLRSKSPVELAAYEVDVTDRPQATGETVETVGEGRMGSGPPG
jgi:hypothetical protein